MSGWACVYYEIIEEDETDGGLGYFVLPCLLLQLNLHQAPATSGQPAADAISTCKVQNYNSNLQQLIMQDA